MRRLPLRGLLALSVATMAISAHAIPPPPPKPPLLREARMTATVKLIEVKEGMVSKITQLCKVSGKIPVYADEGVSFAVHRREIASCTMLRDGKPLPVVVMGAKAVSKKRESHASASVYVVAPDAAPLCADLCGPQPLADSEAQVRVSGNPASIRFSLAPNPVSMLHAKPMVWLEAEIEILK